MVRMGVSLRILFNLSRSPLNRYFGDERTAIINCASKVVSCWFEATVSGCNVELVNTDLNKKI